MGLLSTPPCYTECTRFSCDSTYMDSRPKMTIRPKIVTVVNLEVIGLRFLGDRLYWSCVWEGVRHVTVK